MRNEIVDNILRVERVANTLISNAKDSSKKEILQARIDSNNYIKKSETELKNRYKDLCCEIDNKARDEYNQNIEQCKGHCIELLTNCSERSDQIVNLLVDEVMK